MKTFDNIGVLIPKILLPKKNINMTKWAVVACDQFTSQPEYWKKVADFVGENPSTLKLIYPEVYLNDEDKNERINNIQEHMKDYMENELFDEHENMIYVERKIMGGKVRKGLMLALDLEKYDYNKGSETLIRATEGTIVERLPPRIQIRENALLELPHIMVLIDDPKKTVIEPLREKKDSLKKVYDFDLMMKSGHLSGFAVKDKKLESNIIKALENLALPSVFKKKYDFKHDKPTLLFAMGDGNHSLATAKAIWEIKKFQAEDKKEIMNHPSRYALIELINLHDESLVFEPIHRVLFGLKNNIIDEMKKYYGEQFKFKKCKDAKEMRKLVAKSTSEEQVVGFIDKSGFAIITITESTHTLPVGTLQEFLDKYLHLGNAKEIDYVHGDDIVVELGSKKNNSGFYLNAMNKNDLFKAVIMKGAVPRKTFSMGDAEEKRFYVECRKIVLDNDY